MALNHPTKGAEIGLAYNAQLDNFELRQKLSTILSPLQLPKSFFYLPEIPLLGSGKVDFREVERLVVVPPTH